MLLVPSDPSGYHCELDLVLFYKKVTVYVNVLTC